MRSLFGFLFLILAMNAFGQNTSRVSKTADIVYKEIGEVKLLLDLYRPAEFEGDLPVVIWVHGGGWLKGSKDKCKATWLVEHGYAVASINYRLADVAQWPAQIDDCHDAVRWLRRNADEYGLNPANIGVWGGSAGGHLVALMGTRPVDELGRVQAVCDWFGPSELLTMPPNNGPKAATSNGAKLLGATVREVPELAKDASALDQVSSDDAPFLIQHGSEDPGVPLEQSAKLHAKLEAAGVESTFEVIEGAGHGGPEFNSAEVRASIREFFDRHLK